jgi:regulator of CtrA degradation
MASIEFYDRTMSETMGLLVEARRYLSDRAETDNRQLTIDQGLLTSVETMRLVSRLTESLAWLLTHRAVLTGELSLDDALTPERRLGGHDLCSRDTTEEMRHMPNDFQHLLSRSLDLYQRVAHLDAQISARAAQPSGSGTWPPERGSGPGIKRGH